MKRGRLVALIPILSALFVAAGVSPAPLVDFTGLPNAAPGAPFTKLAADSGFRPIFGSPAFFSVAGGALHLVAAPGPNSKSWNPQTLRKREDKVILRLSREGFRTTAHGTIEIEMAPVTLPGKGADVTDSDRNDACFYLLLGFDGPLHDFAGSKMPDTLAYVWADSPWKSGDTGRDPDYAEFLRYVRLGSGADRPGTLRTLRRDIPADFAKAFPDRKGPLPDLVSVAVMVDSNTVGTRAESILRSVRLIPES